MKQRKRIGKEILSIVLTLLMVVSTITGIVPGSVMTAKADGEIPIFIEGGIDYNYNMPKGSLKKGDSVWEATGNSTEYLELGEGDYKLTGDIIIYNEIRVTGEVTLDLNGYGFFQKSDSYSVIRIMDGGKLIINDSAPTTEHYVHLSNKDTYGTYNITLNGTEHEWDDYGHSVIKVKGGYITGGASSGVASSGGVYIDNNATLNLNGGNIVGNKGSIGGGIYVGKGGSASIANGASVSYNSANRGAGIYVDASDQSKGRLTMTGGTINNNVANFGAGIGMRTKFDWTYSPDRTPTLTISGGSITDNTVVSETNKGGGIYQWGVIELQGTPVISGNKWIQNDTEEPSNILISNYITITGELGKNDEQPLIGVSKLDEGKGDFTSGWSEYNSGKSPWDYFESEMPKYYVDKTPGSNTPEASLQPLLEVKIIAEDAVHTLHKTDSGAKTQYKKSGSADPIDNVIYTVDDDYYFPYDYTNGVNYSDERDDTWTYTHYNTEFTVTRDSFSQITVSGKPREDTTITLPAPTEKATQDSPAAPTAKTVEGSSITLDTVAGCQYSKDGENCQDSPILQNLASEQNIPSIKDLKVMTLIRTHRQVLVLR